MTTTQTEKVKAPKVTKSPQQFVTIEQFQGMTDVMNKLFEAVNELKTKPVEQVKKEEQEVAKAGPARHMALEADWEDEVRSILGEKIDSCWMSGNGQYFNVIIKLEFSNAPKDYLERYKVDMRTVAIQGGGLSAITNFCKLVAQNLKTKERYIK
jgi:hypothetical protein